jgi:hypothetical protein
MRSRTLLLFPLLLISCGKDDTGIEYGIIEGTLSFDDGESASVATHKAFGYDVNGKALLYFSASEDATCADVAEYLDWGDPTDPTAVFAAGHCNLYALVNNFDGSELTVSSDRLAVTWAINCTIGEGSWEWINAFDDPRYEWSGRYWQGDAETWTLTLSGGGGDPFVAELEMNDYDGDYIYEFVDATASGLVSGTTQVEWCADLAETPLLSG